MKTKMTDAFAGTLEEFVKEKDLSNVCLRYWFEEGAEAWYGFFKHIITMPDGSVVVGVALDEEGGQGYIEYYPLSRFVAVAYAERDQDE